MSSVLDAIKHLKNKDVTITKTKMNSDSLVTEGASCTGTFDFSYDGTQIVVLNNFRDWIRTSPVKEVNKISDTEYEIHTQTSIYKLEVLD